MTRFVAYALTVVIIALLARYDAQPGPAGFYVLNRLTGTLYVCTDACYELRSYAR